MMVLPHTGLEVPEPVVAFTRLELVPGGAVADVVRGGEPIGKAFVADGVFAITSATLEYEEMYGYFHGARLRGQEVGPVMHAALLATEIRTASTVADAELMGRRLARRCTDDPIAGFFIEVPALPDEPAECVAFLDRVAGFASTAPNGPWEIWDGAAWSPLAA